MDILLLVALITTPIVLAAPVVAWVLCERKYVRRSAYHIQYNPDTHVFEVQDSKTSKVLFCSESVFECQEYMDLSDGAY